MIYNSIFSYNKDLFFDQIMYLQLFTGVTSKIAFLNSSQNYMLLNPLATAVVAPGAYAGSVTFQNMALLLATETDPMIIKGIVEQKRTSGLKLVIPYEWSNKQSYTNTTQSAITMRYSSTLGNKLKKIYIAPFNATESIQAKYDHANWSYYNNAILPQFGVGPNDLLLIANFQECIISKIFLHANISTRRSKYHKSYYWKFKNII